ncbi:hypothetical protein KIN20_005005, partial [Parelaphostrongylus tenuis]
MPLSRVNRFENMFLAIINDSYVEVKAELARQQEGQGIFGLAEKGTCRSDPHIPNEFSSISGPVMTRKTLTLHSIKLDIKYTNKADDTELIESVSIKCLIHLKRYFL